MAHKMFSLMCLISLAIANGGFGVSAVNVYTVLNNAISTPGGARFNRDITASHARNTLIAATNFIWYTFRQTSAATKKDPNSVVLIVENIGGVAYTSGSEIHLSAQYVANFNGGDVRREIDGVLYHEMTHVLQWSGGAPVWVLEGIADFIRLRAGFVPSGWPRPGDGNRWDQGYGVTARFLDYCESLRWGFVADLNRKMRTGWNINFFNELLGKSVSQLWTDYKRRYGREL